MMVGYGGDLSGWGWVGMTLGMIAFWALLIAAIALVVSGGRRESTTQASAPMETRATPQELLAERFARGEIDEPEYRARLEVLAGSGT